MRIVLPLLCAFLFSCAPESVSRYHTAENEEEIVSLLNERKYDKAVWLIENRHGKNPNGKLGYLLGQAYLGKAGIEPLEFASRVTEPEPDSESARIIFPGCPKERITSLSKIETKCLLKRVYLRAPAADNPDFVKARQLLRQSYPDPASTPEWINTLIGMTETISLVRRAGDLYLYSKGFKSAKIALAFNLSDARWLHTQGKEAMNDAREALARANHSGEKISIFLSGTKANEWFDRIDGTVEYAKAVGLSRFLDFVRENLLKPSDEIRYGESLDKLKTVFDLL